MLLKAGLAVTLAFLAFQHFIGTDKKHDEFMREQLLEALVENAKASSSSAEAMKDVAESMGEVVHEFDQLSDETRGVNARFDRLFPELIPPKPDE